MPSDFEPAPAMMKRVFVALQYVLPQHALSRLIYGLTRCRWRWLKNMLIRAFVRGYRPVMDDALEPDPLRYASFNEFFTRRLRGGARPLATDPARILSPADGTLSAAGAILEDTLLQAKGHDFRLQELLGDADYAAKFRHGSYATIYLAPYNYHRLHMPLDGSLRAAWHVPGRLFSVNDATAALVPRLFARNERVVCIFDGDPAPFAVVLIGALFVGSIATSWHDEITPHPARGIRRLQPTGAAMLQQPRGAELGLFNMGSTIILLLPPGAGRWDEDLKPGRRLRVGLGIGTLEARLA